MTIEEITTECEKIAAARGVEIYWPIKLNGRLKATLGRVSYEWVGCNLVIKDMEFSKTYASQANDTEMLDLIIHEMTHAILFIETGEKHGHDAMFKALNKELGGDGETCATIDRSKMKPKYTVTCSECGKHIADYYRAGNLVNFPTRYLSGCCKAPIIVVQNY